MHYIVFRNNSSGNLNSDLFALLFDCCGNDLLQIFPGLLSSLVNDSDFAFRLLQLALNDGNLIGRQLAPVFLQKPFRTGDDVIQGAGICRHVFLQSLEMRMKGSN